jgi:2-keto-4-pentenoate hydratase
LHCRSLKEEQERVAMMNSRDRAKAASILVTAERKRKQASQLSKNWPAMTFDDAYAISSEVHKRKLRSGAKLIGYKVGLTSKAMQRSSQISRARLWIPDRSHDGSRWGQAFA